mgnify:FL=1
MSLFVGLGGRERADGERMNILLHHVAKRVVDHTLSQHSAAALESGRYDKNPVVTAPVTCSSMAGVQGAVVLDVEDVRIEAVGKDFPDPGDRPGAHGSVFRNGRTVVRANTP